MALKIPKLGLSEMLKDGYKHMQGLEEAVFRNINACKQISDVVRTSLGPNGKNKMIINHLEKLFVTNDAATILKEMEIVHPAAKMLVMASEQQQKEIGDNANFVVVLAGELLYKAESLLRSGLHPSEVIEGYKKATEHALVELEKFATEKITDVKDKTQLLRIVKPAVASKQFGLEDFLGKLVVDAALSVMPSNPSNFNVDNIRVTKILGASTLDSKVIRGMVFEREPESVLTSVTKCKVAIFTCPLDISRTETKGTVLITSSKELQSFSIGEEKQLEEQFRQLHDAGIKVLVTGSTIGEMALHFVNRFEMVAVKVVSKFDLRRLCRLTGATALARIGTPLPEEVGTCDVVETIEIGGDRVTVFRQDKEESNMSTVVVRGATQNLMDDIERSIDDAVNIVKMITKDPRIIPGAGATEIELARRLTSYGEKCPGLEQYSIKKFAEAFEVIPRTLAENAGHKATESLALLYAAHQSGKSTYGIDVENEENAILDAAQAEIWDSYISKYWAIKFAASAATTVLSVDQIIMSKPAGGPKPRDNPNWDED